MTEPPDDIATDLRSLSLTIKHALRALDSLSAKQAALSRRMRTAEKRRATWPTNAHFAAHVGFSTKTIDPKHAPGGSIRPGPRRRRVPAAVYDPVKVEAWAAQREADGLPARWWLDVTGPPLGGGIGKATVERPNH